MATTWIDTIHKEETYSDKTSIKRRLEYILNDEKTDNGRYTFAHLTEPMASCASDEFIAAKQYYKNETGRTQENPILAYSIRQAFLPGEVDADKCMELGKELAMRITGGEYAFVLSTHVDKAHLHNHIIFCAYNDNMKEKFENPFNSFKNIRKISDELCLEHGLSIIEEPQLGSNVYTLIDKYKENNEGKRPTKRFELELYIEAILRNEKPTDMEMLYETLRTYGCEVNDRKKNGEPLAHVSIRLPQHKKATRLNKLSEGYTEEDLHKRITEIAQELAPQFSTSQEKKLSDEEYAFQYEEYEAIHSAKTSLSQHQNLDAIVSRNEEQKADKNDGMKTIEFKRLINIENSKKAQENTRYKFWAKGFNIKEGAKTLLYLQSQGLANKNALAERIERLQSEIDSTTETIAKAEIRMKEIATIQKHIGTYRKTKDIYAEYIHRNKDVTFYAENKNAIDSCVNAKAHFNSLQKHKLPTIAQLRNEYASLQARKNKAYAVKNSVWKTKQELLKAQKNLNTLFKEHDTKNAEHTKPTHEHEIQGKKRKKSNDPR